MAVKIENRFQAFPRNRRLLSQSEFQYVFSGARKVANRSFTVLVRKNSCQQARLGMAISKKIARRAVDRNRIKRHVREIFRCHGQQMDHVDIVVLGRNGIAERNRRELASDIQELFSRLLINT